MSRYIQYHNHECNSLERKGLSPMLYRAQALSASF
ncbi:hypothetical protein F0A17_19445 [Billgrantia pellis]|uniref:Integrase catalytic domain-containing protein n=1 Tax=Billgrantia pellis TaxID=2606936 RepID=A0A7V7FXY6_9GAMM|nr:hypothetical protein F0A17_19445 [Halomonas pellis]